MKFNLKIVDYDLSAIDGKYLPKKFIGKKVNMQIISLNIPSSYV